MTQGLVDFFSLSSVLRVGGGGRVSGGRGFVFRGVELVGRGILQDEDEAAGVGGPGEVVDVLNGVSELLGIAAEAIEKPDLGLAAIASGEEGDVFVVGGPAWVGGGERRRR